MEREEQIEKARELLACGALSKEACDAIKNDFPELAESEDERIRKELMNFVAKVKDIAKSGRDSWAVRKEDVEMCERFLAYLEKQKDSVSNAKYIEDVAHAFEDGKKKGIEEKQKEQKPAEWSEEDEYCINQLIVFCENCIQQDSAAIRCANWLKSLRPQHHWKPSEEQPEVDLEAEIDKMIRSVFYDLNGIAIAGSSEYADVEAMVYIARHFYELGLNARKEE